MNIYVGNLALEMTEEELRKEFIVFGQVISITIMSDKYIGSGQPRIYGFIEMASKSEGEAAVAALNGQKLRGRIIDVVGALPLSGKENTAPIEGKKPRHFGAKTRQREY